MASAPIFAATPKLGIVQVSTANTNRDGSTGTYATAYTAGSSGSLVYKIQIVAAGTTTAGVVRFFITDTGGTNARLFEEVIVPAITPSTTVRVFEYVLTFPQNCPLVLQNGMLIKASTNNAETFNIFTFVGDI